MVSKFLAIAVVVVGCALLMFPLSAVVGFLTLSSLKYGYGLNISITPLSCLCAGYMPLMLYTMTHSGKRSQVIG